MQNYNLQNANPNIFNSNLTCLLPISPSLLTENQSPLKTAYLYSWSVYLCNFGCYLPLLSVKLFLWFKYKLTFQ